MNQIVRSPADVIVALENNNSKTFKENLLEEEMQKYNLFLFTGFYCALNSFVTFGIKDVPTKPDGVVEHDLFFPEFFESIKKLATRELSGNAARDFVKTLMDRSSSHMWNNFYRRIILKDMKCGVDIKTINKCAKKLNLDGNMIPVFSCQLAFDSKLHKNKLTSEKIIQPKIDGVRVLTIVYTDGRVNQYSRNGKELFNFKNIKEEFSELAKDLKVNMVFDGEIVSKSFQDSMTQLYRKTNVKTDDAILYLFDVIPLDDFLKGVCEIPQRERLVNLQVVPLMRKLHSIQVLDYLLVNLDENIGEQEFYNYYDHCLKNGFEGIMIKDPNAPYECKRSTAWLKLKPTDTIDLTIIGCEPGTSKYKGMLGALVCSGQEEDKEILVKVGSGLTDEQRQEFWDNKESLIGKIVEIKYDIITKNKEGNYSLRFPRFLKFRGFDDEEKI